MACHLSVSGGVRPPAAHSLILPVCVCEQCVCPGRFRCLGTGCADKSERLSHSNGTAGCFVPPASSWRAAVCGDVSPSVWQASWTLMRGDEGSFAPRRFILDVSAGLRARLLRSLFWFFIFFFFFYTKGAEKILLGVSLCPRRVHSVFTVCCFVFFCQVIFWRRHKEDLEQKRMWLRVKALWASKRNR